MKKNLLLGAMVLIIVGAWTFVAQAASSGPILPTSSVNGSASGRTVQTVGPWTNPGNITADDGVFATAGSSLGVSRYASTTSYGFNIPIQDTITGFLVEVKKKGTNDVPNATFVYDDSLRLLKANAVIGTDKADTTTPWSATNVYVSYGGDGILWGTTWTPSEVNSSGFGVAFSSNPEQGDLSALASVDAIRVTIFYVDPHGNAAQVTQTAGTIIQTKGTVIIP